MNKPFKTLALLLAVVSAVPVIAMESTEIQPGDVVGTIGGETIRIEEDDIIGTVGGPVTQVTSENMEKKSKSKWQRLCDFLSKDKAKIIACGLVSAFFLYRIFYVHLPEIRQLQQERIEFQAFTKKFSEFIELVKNSKPNFAEQNG